MIRFTVPLAALIFATSAVAAETPPGDPGQSIGVATMQQDGTIVMRLRSLPPGPIGEATLTVHPGDKDYRETLDHIGGLKPGETKSVPPWPDTQETTGAPTR